MSAQDWKPKDRGRIRYKIDVIIPYIEMPRLERQIKEIQVMVGNRKAIRLPRIICHPLDNYLPPNLLFSEVSEFTYFPTYPYILVRPVDNSTHPGTYSLTLIIPSQRDSLFVTFNLTVAPLPFIPPPPSHVTQDWTFTDHALHF